MLERDQAPVLPERQGQRTPRAGLLAPALARAVRSQADDGQGGCRSLHSVHLLERQRCLFSRFIGQETLARKFLARPRAGRQVLGGALPAGGGIAAALRGRPVGEQLRQTRSCGLQLRSLRAGGQSGVRHAPRSGPAGVVLCGEAEGSHCYGFPHSLVGGRGRARAPAVGGHGGRVCDGARAHRTRRAAALPRHSERRNGDREVP
mmetsp:Transcript_71967/g.198609  ORF Transcript_71967/g.198609 Transcript_71967/m.198609 type:complete len:205 (+) Transcript_71967:385-999(+)